MSVPIFGENRSCDCESADRRIHWQTQTGFYRAAWNASAN